MSASFQIEDPSVRFRILRKMVRSLPETNYETLKYLCNHLCRVIEFSETNKMDLKNLATLFGPTLVRTSDDDMLAMVRDMGHQCQIIECILRGFQYFFEDSMDDYGEDAGWHSITVKLRHRYKYPKCFVSNTRM